MNIAAITTVTMPSKNASIIQVMKVCQALQQNGHSVTLTMPGSKIPPFEELAEQYGLRERFNVNAIKFKKIFKKYDFAWKAVLLAIREQKNLIYTWSPQAAVFAMSLGLPVILEVHDVPTGFMGKRLLRSFFTLSSRKRVLVITQALSDKLEKIMGRRYDRRMVEIAPNGLDPAQYTDLPEPAAARNNLHLPDKTTIGCSGHLYKGRGLVLFQGLAQAFPNLQFLWVGGNDGDVQNWQKQLNEAGIQNIYLTGFIPNTQLPQYQAACDVLLMPYEKMIAGSGGGNSVDICSPMKMFDYLAVGRPIMTSDLPVLHEVLNKKNAVFCKTEDLEDWKRQLDSLLKNQKQIMTLSENAKKDSERYTWQERQAKALAGF